MTSDFEVKKAIILFSVVVSIWQFSVLSAFSKAVTVPAREYHHRGGISSEDQRDPTLSDSAEASFSQGLRYYDLGRWHEAIEAFKKAAAVKPDYELAYFGLGITYSRLEIWEKALASFAKAVELSPYHAEAYLGLGMAYTVLGRNNDAMEACKKAIQIKPGYAQARYALALIYLKLGDRGSAQEEFGILKTLDQSLAEEIIHLLGNSD